MNYHPFKVKIRWGAPDKKRKAIVKRGKGKYSKQYYAVLIADNGEPLAHTEHQTRKSRLRQMLAKYFPGFKIVDA